MVDQIDRYIRTQIPANEMAGILDNIGLPTSGINLAYSNSGTIGNADAEILGSLQAVHHPTADYVAKLREELPKRFPGTAFFFEPADIVAQTLNFGIPAPLDIQIVGQGCECQLRGGLSDRGEDAHRAGRGGCAYSAAARPATLTVGRGPAREVQEVGFTEQDVANNVLISLSSSFQTAPNFWLNPKNGVTYSMAVQTPQYRWIRSMALRPSR